MLIGTGTAGAFVARFKAYVGCEPFASRMCVPEIDEIIAQYDASVNPAEREELAAKANAAVADGYYKIPIYWFSFIDAVGPRIAVMYLGKIVELAESQELCENPQHPYTRALFAAALPSSPDEEQEEETIAGEVPSALNIPPGCRFNPRCPFVMRHCSEEEPELKEVSPNHFVSCYLY